MNSPGIESRLRLLRVTLHVVGASGLALLLVAAWSYLIRPIDAQRHVTFQRMQWLENTLAAADEIRSEHHSLSKRLADGQDQEASLQARIPDDAAEAEFLALASELAAESGLDIQDYRPGKPVNELSCSSLEVQLICEGDYPALCRFLDGMATSPRLSRVERLHVDAGKQKAEYLIEISVQLYFAAHTHDSSVEGGKPHA